MFSCVLEATHTSASSIPGPCVEDKSTRVIAAIRGTLCDQRDCSGINETSNVRLFVLNGTPSMVPDPPRAMSETDARRV